MSRSVGVRLPALRLASIAFLPVLPVAAILPVQAAGRGTGDAGADAGLGRAIYTNCAACHGERGQGGFAPPFAGNANVEYSDFMITYVERGSRRMPAFAEQLSPNEIAAVVSFVRSSWGNAFGPVDVSEVEAVMGSGS